MRPADAIADLDAILRVVAPHEHPPGTPRTILTFAELGLDDLSGHVGGFSAEGLDLHAARVRHDERLVGLPVIAVSVPDRGLDELDLVVLRHVALHELGHAILLGRRPVTVPPPEEYREHLRRGLTSSTPAASAVNHGPAWWRLFVVLAARVEQLAPALMPIYTLRPAAAAYGYGHAAADEWLAAVLDDRELLDLPLAEIVGRFSPSLDSLLDQSLHSQESCR